MASLNFNQIYIMIKNLSVYLLVFYKVLSENLQTKNVKLYKIL